MSRDDSLDEFLGEVRDEVHARADAGGRVRDFAAMIARARAIDPAAVPAEALAEVRSYAPVVALRRSRRPVPEVMPRRRPGAWLAGAAALAIVALAGAARLARREPVAPSGFAVQHQGPRSPDAPVEPREAARRRDTTRETGVAPPEARRDVAQETGDATPEAATPEARRDVAQETGGGRSEARRGEEREIGGGRSEARRDMAQETGGGRSEARRDAAQETGGMRPEARRYMARETGDMRPEARRDVAQETGDARPAARRDAAEETGDAGPEARRDAAQETGDPTPAAQRVDRAGSAAAQEGRAPWDELDRRAREAWRRGELAEARRLLRALVESPAEASRVELAFGDLFVLARQAGDPRGLERAWRDYLARFPRGIYAEDASAGLCRRAADAACWTRHLAAWPEGSHASEARRAIEVADGAP